ncbi:hypothetical protein SDC9_147875 [bioreactor metagenome]|uniref:Uncharacterized protein n=1 Tax=bioreactor metagenome TaxID=1076179 RepID=A0A645EHQ3_9ZZZZ
MRIHALQADQIVAGGFFDGCDSVLADVQAQQHGLALRAGPRLLHVADERVQPFVVEAQAIDQRVGLGQTEHARLGVARLRLGGDGAHLHKTKSHGGQAVNDACILVQARRHAHAIREVQTRKLDRVIHRRLAPRPLQRRALALRQHVHGEFMGLFRVHVEENWASECVR